MKIILILLIILTGAFSIVFLIISHFRKVEKQRYIFAAGNIIKEDFLIYSLQNPMGEKDPLPVPNSKKTMLYIKAKNQGQKLQLVFDPEKEILIGRDQNNSNIYLNEVLVSQQHCCIFFRGNAVYLQDMNSSNGTYLKRGLSKSLIINGQCVQLRSGDKLLIGSNIFKVTLFYYDMALM